MKQFKNWIPACILFSLMLSLTSCQGLIDAILGDHADNSSSSSGGGGTTPTAQKKTAEIKIEVSKIYIWNGDETERALTTNSDGAITVTSSDEASVTVTYNQTKGTMTIKSIKDAGNKNATITINVAETGNYLPATKIIPVNIFDIDDFFTAVENLTLDKTELNLKKDESATLTATLDPAGPKGDNVYDPSVLWKSNNESVATVDENGKVTAIATGKTTIIATANNFGQADVKAACDVSVTTPVTDIVSERGSVTVEKGHTNHMNTTIYPDDADDKRILYKSSNPKVVTIDQNGDYKTIAGGTATLTAITNDGGFEASCTVFVTVSVTGVTINKTELHMVEGNTAPLSATIAPADALNQKVTWTSSDDTTAKVDANGLVTALKEGTADITVTTDEYGYSAKCTVTIDKLLVPSTAVSLNYSTLPLSMGETGTLIATMSPSNTTDAVSFTSANEKIAKVDAKTGVVTAMSVGTTTITATTTSELTATCTVVVTALVPTPTDYSGGGDPFK